MSNKQLVQRNGDSQSPSRGDVIQRADAIVRAVRLSYGMSRLELGFSLLSIKHDALWEGKAESFSGYLETLRLNQTAAMSYMRVADCFIVRYKVSDSILRRLAMCSMKVLDQAASVVKDETLGDVLAIVLSLRTRDALEALKEFSTKDKPTLSAEVRKVINGFMALPDDGRSEVRARLSLRTPASVQQTPAQ